MKDERQDLELREGVTPYFSLPQSALVSTEALSGSFNKVTNSYKFYWFLSILEEYTTHDNPIIQVDDIIARMLSHVWYPVTYFRLHFGKQDKLSTIVSEVRAVSNIIDEKDPVAIRRAIQALLAGEDFLPQQKLVQSLRRYVPTRFLTPWFPAQLKGVRDGQKDKKIIGLAEAAFNEASQRSPLYRFVQANKAIEIHPDWRYYLFSQVAILKGFCLWKLIQYLQKHNPNTPGISEKLFPPQKRSLKSAWDFWKIVFKERPTPLQCLYSHQELTQQSASLDHFLPWSYVAHDLMWNLIPVLKSANSSKSNCLPDLQTYFDVFAKEQYDAIQIVGNTNKKKLLEDYIILTKEESIEQLLQMQLDTFSDHLKDVLSPQLQIAKNMGFEENWTYSLSS